MFSGISKGMFKKPNKEPLQLLQQTSGQTVAEPHTSTLPHAAPPPVVRTAPHKKDSNWIPSEEPALPMGGGLLHSQMKGMGILGAALPKVLAVGGGKGGIGKSFVAANLGVLLAQKGYRVAMVDLDLGAANLHTCLGVGCPKAGIFDFMNNQVENLEDIGVQGGVPRLTLYGGGQEFWQQVRPQPAQKIKLISKLQRLNADWVILDLGAGTHINTLDFFIFSHVGLCVVTPEPTAIENAYVFLKSILFRRLQSIVKAIHEEEAAAPLLSSLEDAANTSPPFAQIQAFSETCPQIGSRIQQLVQMTQMGIVMNQVRSKADQDLGPSLVQICKKYFGFGAEFLGASVYDDMAWKAIRAKRPVVLDAPQSQSSASLQKIMEALLQRYGTPEKPSYLGAG